ncbi:hypothetical protein ACQPYE_13840 [Actinosynnema sp. CA-299493]
MAENGDTGHATHLHDFGLALVRRRPCGSRTRTWALTAAVTIPEDVAPRVIGWYT